ncbi:tRNA (guanosine(37)-N1)-methyltransferase TrmD [Candidatus Giovannonibacteria bacterium RIFOXYD1_FULL_48_21]|nr:MAG: tRNA (guanosine(37)-N1)-methyltransferase TrmD [Candidatus Giovannonibacteria bacterium RIFOXYD1_FULL_48_21]
MSRIRFDIITIFPHIFDSYFSESIIKRAIEKKKIQIKTWNLRDFTKDKHKKVDDKPYGGGAGMVLQAEPILRAVQKMKSGPKAKIILLSAKGKQFTQKMAYDWSKKCKNIILISGRYEGIDERVRKTLKAEEVSAGPYVLTGGELPAMIVVDAVSRHVPGVLGRAESLEEKRYGVGVPAYTRPEILNWQGKKYSVPKILLSGNHKKVEAWRERHKRRAPL